MSDTAPNGSTIDTIEKLLRRIDRLELPQDWPEKTPQELHLDSLDLVELQLELESSFGVALTEDTVAQSPLATMPFYALAAHIDNLRSSGAAT